MLWTLRQCENMDKASFEGVGKYEVPRILPMEIEEPVEMIGFNFAAKHRHPEQVGVHFFLKDYQFSRLWTSPDIYRPYFNDVEMSFRKDSTGWSKEAGSTWFHEHGHYVDHNTELPSRSMAFFNAIQRDVLAFEDRWLASNAATWVETTYGRYTVAGAISLRNRLRAKTGMLVTGTNFEGFLQSVLEAQFSTGVAAADEKNKALEKQAEAMRLSILGKDGKARDDKPLGVVDAYVKENTTELVDPLGAEKRVAELKEKKEKLLAELETQIKVSNATTLIEF